MIAIFRQQKSVRQAVKEISSCLATFIVPVVLNYVSAKWTLAIGSSLFAFYFASFFYIENVVYFTANIMLGIAFSLTFTSLSTYQMRFSTRQTLAQNSARVQGIANISFIAGGMLYMYITSTHAKDKVEQYRYYSKSETQILCGCLFVFCLINLLLTSCLPTKEVQNSVLSENPQQKLEFVHQIKASVSILVHPLILLFVPRFLNNGLLVSFYMTVYPTSLQYSTILSQQYQMMTAYYAFALFAGSTVCSIIVAPLNRRFNDFGLRPLYYITVGVQLVAYTIAVLTVPNTSTIRPTAESALIKPQLLLLVWVCITSFLLGFADSSTASCSAVLCSRLLPKRATHTYSAARFYRGFAVASIFFCSPILTMQAHAVILVAATLISAISFDFAVKRMDKRNSNEVHDTDQNNITMDVLSRVF